MKGFGFQRDLDDVVEALRNAKLRGTRCTLLIGAGCSVEAGIPTAEGFVRRIRTDYRRLYQRADPKDYCGCMAELPKGVRHALIAEYVDQAKINWGHIGIALLVQHGYVDRVLTTNFDPLIVRACAALGEFPAVYDFAASQHFKPEAVPEKAVFHLHGQRTGFVLLNTPEEFSRHREALEPLFQDAGRGRMWVVAGYSGENDPVFEHLTRVPEFEHALYWVGYGDAEPPGHVAERLLVKGKYAYFVSGHTADSFFVQLTQRLNVFPPLLIARPFSYLAATLETLAPFSGPGQLPGVSVTEITSGWINAAISRFELDARSQADAAVPPAAVETSEIAAALEALMAGDQGTAISVGERHAQIHASGLSPILARAYVMAGDRLAGQAQFSRDGGAGQFMEAEQWYAKALFLKPDLTAALTNWAGALVARAKREPARAAERLLREAERKYADAFAIAPDQHDVLHNWGMALVARARLRSREGTLHLLEDARSEMAEALQSRHSAEGLPVRPDLEAAGARLEEIVGILMDAEEAVRHTPLSPQPVVDALRRSPTEAEALLDQLHRAAAVWRELHARKVEWPRFVQFRDVAAARLADWSARDEATLEKIYTKAAEFQVLRDRFAAAQEEIRRLVPKLLRVVDPEVRALGASTMETADAVIDSVAHGRLEPADGVGEIEDVLTVLRDLAQTAAPPRLDPEAVLRLCLAVLGLVPPVDMKTVKQAYRRQAMRYHPDYNKSPDAAERFREIQAAYECVLRFLR